MTQQEISTQHNHGTASGLAWKYTQAPHDPLPKVHRIKINIFVEDLLFELLFMT